MLAHDSYAFEHQSAPDGLGQTFAQPPTDLDQPANDTTHVRPNLRALPEPGDILEDRYRIEGPIGSGGMAYVFSARHMTIDRRVALKVLAPRLASSSEHVARFMREARAASAIEHPCVVKISDFGHTPEGGPFFAMEYLEGEDLDDMLYRLGPLPWEQLGPMALQICGAIHAAHQSGIVHRDIKPSNIFVIHGSNNIKVLDFGIAKFSASLQQRALTHAGSVMGTMGYLSPEALLGDRVDHRADIYSLGVTLYVLVSGLMPFGTDDEFASIERGAKPKPLPPEVPRSVAAIIQKCIATDPCDRFSSVRNLFERILATLPQRGPAALSTMSALANARMPHGTWPPRGMSPDSRSTRPGHSLIFAGALGLFATVAATAYALSPRHSDEVNTNYLSSFGVLPSAILGPGIELQPEKIELGRRLFFEPKLSKAEDIACASCHASDSYGTDGRPVAIGHGQQTPGRNTPTVYNSAGHVAQGWSGAAPTVETQVIRPLFNPVEMASDRATVLQRLRQDEDYPGLFAAAFPEDEEPISIANLSMAIGAYERTLVTPSRWDRFLSGNHDALSAQERRGLNTFVEVGCVQCHSGTYVGGSQFQKLGLLQPWPNSADPGRYDETEQDGDWMMFKVASLRNVAQTAPYFHDGSIDRLPTAVEMMARHQLDRTLTDTERDDIVAFLATLTGEPEVARQPG